jgi:hypothetical protein
MFFKRGKQDKLKAKEAEKAAEPDKNAAQSAQAAQAASQSKSAKTDEAGKDAPKDQAKDPSKEPSKEAAKGAATGGGAPAVEADSLGFATTADLKAEKDPVGQARAVEALLFGAGIKGSGYNVLVVGRQDSGLIALTRSKISEIAAAKKRPPDWVYVRYFDEEGGYRALKLPGGSGKTFVAAMGQVIDRLADALPAAFATEDYELKRRTIEEEFRFSREDALEALRREAESQNIALLRTPAGIAVAPILDGKVVRKDVFNSVPEALRQEVKTKIAALEAEIEKILAERPGAEKARRDRLLALNEEVAGRQVRAVIDDMAAEFGSVAGVERFLKSAARDLIRKASLFLSLPGRDGAGFQVGIIDDHRFARYRVHSMAPADAVADGKGAPLIEEVNPTYANLFGRIEVAPEIDGRQAQVVRIRSGALHRANGGFLILDARALLASRSVAEALARALDTNEIRFDPPAEPVAVPFGEIPDLEPIPLEVKLILIADAETQRTLAKDWPALMRHLKVEAVFEDAVERSADVIAQYARRIAAIVADNELKPVEAKGVALLIDEAARRAGGNGKLSTEIGHISDLCREADYIAQTAGREVTSAADVERALKDRAGRAEPHAPTL